MPDEATVAGQAVYSRRMLGWYDFLVLNVSNRWIWRCPTARLLDWYDKHVSDRHLDVGVGTGYFLDRCRFPSERPQITLVDLNENCLAAAAARISRYRPATIQADVLQPFDLAGGPFQSIGVNYLLHCLPGNLDSKGRVFDHLAVHLAPGGTLFGSTLLTDGVPRNVTARHLAAFYNRKRIFCNAEDSLDELRRALDARFANVEVNCYGCAALFAASGPRFDSTQGRNSSAIR